MPDAPILQNPPSPVKHLLFIFFVLALGAIGQLIWNELEATNMSGSIRWHVIGMTMVLVCFPPILRPLMLALDRIRHPSTRARNRATIIIALLSSGWLLLTAVLQERDLFPKMHDECSYVIAAQMLARGRLSMPALPLPDFFESFYVLVRPVYASMYFIGTALLYVPGVWLHLPTWVMPVLVSGAIVGLLYRIVAELTDGVGGILAVLLALSLSRFREFSIMVTGHLPMLLMALILFHAWLQWRKTNRLRWAAVMGVAAGWAAIIRPTDATIYAAPIALAVLLSTSRPRRFSAIGVMIAAALPFLALQVAANVQVTGHPLHSPYSAYIDREMPGARYGFHTFDPKAVPESSLPQKRQLYTIWVQPHLARHNRNDLPNHWRYQILPRMIDTLLPARLLLIPACIGLLGLTRRPRWALAMTLPLFFPIYVCNPFYHMHYALLIIPAIALLVVMGTEAIASVIPRYRRQVSAILTAILVAICLTSTWELDRLLTPARDRMHDAFEPSAYLKAVNVSLQSAEKPAIVLFRYPPGFFFVQEPVYNMDVAWPDDARVIRAHDLGPVRNQELFEYYARTQPDRTIYTFDMTRKKPLERLGKANELAAARR